MVFSSSYPVQVYNIYSSLVHHILFKMAEISKHNEICNAVLEELVNSKSSKMVSREKYEMIVILKTHLIQLNPSLRFG